MNADTEEAAGNMYETVNKMLETIRNTRRIQSGAPASAALNESIKEVKKLERMIPHASLKKSPLRPELLRMKNMLKLQLKEIPKGNEKRSDKEYMRNTKYVEWFATNAGSINASIAHKIITSRKITEILEMIETQQREATRMYAADEDYWDEW